MLGLAVEQIRFSLGRSGFPPGPPHGGSMTMASVGSAIRAACIAAQEEAAKRAIADQRSPVFRAPLDDVEWNEGRLRRRGDPSPGQPYRDIVASTGQPIEALASAQRDPEVARRNSMHAFGAVFAEVAVDPDSRYCDACVDDEGRLVSARLSRTASRATESGYLEISGGAGGVCSAQKAAPAAEPRFGRPRSTRLVQG
jgi:xanthine dehydrogenase YagR molybdenum-binding subunit